ncbi:hypothetical protein Kpol_1058p33 [Vanderwaltozyma polyspora DSM 70294]|uniref:SPX domain-containing protein n=1 Tax=Vanderwaltozyma polyspora (strain ATCC 22028 / DSM 70294 / BCRC 21397 / CBS 2163 / NBRC 10782 / NRRL Y-8283 / UCD 57-17) TaxID=436907 RepID=A7TJR7_VANPO|nr:uncharacterized protein Kpol_1058p33 [Vanderwaltozyma polyspora DSM 70294]EDO17496.1 hypothetical protein Kpol_1058p33 [Vanderwaltozyma polyspora DSM 70294]
MLFGVKLTTSIFPPWKSSYINYDYLKELLKEGETKDKGSNASWTEKDESKFVEVLDKELEKVYSFQAAKYNALTEKLNRLEEQTKTQEMIQNLDFDSFQRVLEDSLSETGELDKFARINFTGFVKIVKKHDKLHPKYPSVKSLLEVRLKELPFHSEESSPLLYQISFLYNIVRSNSNGVSNSLIGSAKLSSLANSGAMTDMSFKSYKFWIHRDNLMEVKTRILRHLPVLVYAAAPTENDDLIDRFESDILDDDGGVPSSSSSTEGVEGGLRSRSYDPVINTLYFDNEHFELYNNKLMKSSGAPTLRLRWIGKLVDKPDLFLEKRTIIEDENDGSIDFEETRIKLQQKYVNGFIFNGDPQYKEVTLNKLKNRGAMESEIETLENNIDTIQKFVMQEQLQPVFRTVYTRTAFQIPGDDRVRVTIDSDILYIREDSFDKNRPIRDSNSWHRSDIDANVSNPMKFLRTGEYSKFPYSVMEIKVKNFSATSMSASMQSKNLPNKHNIWISDLKNSHLVKETPKFSKYVQGIASLFGEDERLDILPFWLPDLETDIRKDPTEAFEEEKKRKEKQMKILSKLDEMRKSSSKISPSSIKQEEEELRKIRDADLEDHESSEEEEEEQRKGKLKKRKQKQKQKDRAEPELTFLQVLAGRDSKLHSIDSEEEEIELPPGVKKPIELLKNAGPIKVEAKVWLANERTFNRWLKVTVLFSILTFSIFNSVKQSGYPNLANALAYIYFGLTMFSGLWSYSVYIKRLNVIRERSGEHLDAPLGPILVAFVLTVTLVVNFVVAFREEAKKQLQHSIVMRVAENTLSDRLKPIQSYIFQLVGAETN